MLQDKACGLGRDHQCLHLVLRCVALEARDKLRVYRVNAMPPVAIAASLAKDVDRPPPLQRQFDGLLPIVDVDCAEAAPRGAWDGITYSV